ncbi:unnamed protein product [Kuraishia capsulata CBS 1993]|uniref:BHLH domain-containing protein n=1 Tax=Kuraishia capsulata CBS 1993 TaxID=1382522 RepID=W6MW41_9ASCO|nr:uncharacterized protein KUCA_T00002844001 [Kuraishia capsulata CBS 1993]CDK26870.1 unnamed protein product [Kuraishia capsulata CBS 1993]
MNSDWLSYVDLEDYAPPSPVSPGIEYSPPSPRRRSSTPKKRKPRKRLTESQKLAHNAIEKRYRVNINAKIVNLQKLLPYEVQPDPNSETPKLNKSAVLDRASEYILSLEREREDLKFLNEHLRAELEMLRNDIL